MQTQTERRVKISACLFFALMPLAGCAGQQQANTGTVGSIPSHAAPVQIRQILKQQEAQRMAYYKKHPEAGGRGPTAGVYSAQMEVIPPTLSQARSNRPCDSKQRSKPLSTDCIPQAAPKDKGYLPAGAIYQ